MVAVPAADIRLERVLTPLQIGRLTVANRLALSATTTNLATGGLVTDELIAFYRERARGGVGLIVTEGIAVHPSAAPRHRQLVATDAALPGLSRLAAAMHDDGVPVVAQLQHPGRSADLTEASMAPWAPSASRASSSIDSAHVMTEHDIAALIDAFARAAALMVSAGFDGVELHLGPAQLLEQFLSPAWNRRDDDYGGDEGRRLRLPVEVVRAVTHALGGRAVLGIRVLGDEGRADGLTPDACQRAVHTLTAAAPLAYVSVTHATAAPGLTSPAGAELGDMHEQAGAHAQAQAGMKAAVGALPLMLVSRFTSLQAAEEALVSGRGDLVAMSRALIADPNAVRKASAGRTAEIRPCVACNRCYAQIAAGGPIRCTVNPRAGRELTHPPRARAASPKRVVVVGGGAAGMQAAREAALAGHRVLLCERSHELGGQVRLARQGIGRHELDRLREWQQEELTRLGVRIQLDTHVDAARLAQLAPDVVVVATGSRPTIAALPGFGAMAPASKLLDLEPVAGEHVAILDHEGGWVTASATETAIARGGRVTVVTPADTLLWGLPGSVRAGLLDRLSRRAVSVYVMRKAVSYQARTLILEDVVSGRVEHVPGVGRVYVSRPRQSDDQLLEELRTSHAPFRLVVIGDAHAPGQLLEAVREGYDSAAAI